MANSHHALHGKTKSLFTLGLSLTSWTQINAHLTLAMVANGRQNSYN